MSWGACLGCLLPAMLLLLHLLFSLLPPALLHFPLFSPLSPPSLLLLLLPALLLLPHREFIADLETPVSTLLKLRAHAASSAHPKHCFLLESVEGGERLARYSFVGAGPRQLLCVGQAGAPGVTHTGDPLVPLQAALAPL